MTKARILEAVREGKGEQAAQRLEGLKKGDMAEAAALLAGTGWLPEPLRTVGVQTVAAADETAIGDLSVESDNDHPAGEAEAVAAE